MKTLLGTIVLMAITLTGCAHLTAPPEEPGALGIVATSHANASQLSQNQWVAFVESELRAGDSVVVVSDDGAPRVLGEAYLVGLPINPDSNREAIEDYAWRTATVAHGAESSTAETDPIAALNLLSRSLEPESRALACRILMSGSGLSTAGVLQMQTTSISVDSGDVVEALTKADTLPDLSGCSVTWINLGSVSGSQEPLPESNLRQLEQLWRDILQAAGATATEFQYGSAVVRASRELPAVTPVPIVQDPQILSMPCVVEITDGEVGFQSDSSVFLDEEDAEAAVVAMADRVRDCLTESSKISVVATTSSAGTGAGRATVSQNRAEALAQLLANELRVPMSRIDRVGVGYCEIEIESAPSCVDDRDDSGLLLLGPAQQNRRAIITISKSA